MNKEYVRVMLGSQENSQFITVKKGTRVIIELPIYELFSLDVD